MDKHAQLNESTGQIEVSEDIASILDGMVEVLESAGYEIEEGIEAEDFLEQVAEVLETDDELGEQKQAALLKSYETVVGVLGEAVGDVEEGADEDEDDKESEKDSDEKEGEDDEKESDKKEDEKESDEAVEADEAAEEEEADEAEECEGCDEKDAEDGDDEEGEDEKPAKKKAGEEGEDDKKEESKRHKLPVMHGAAHGKPKYRVLPKHMKSPKTAGSVQIVGHKKK